MIFLNSELTNAERSPEARFQIVPMPLEKTVSYGSGTADGPAALIEASDQLERLWRGMEPCAAGIYTTPPIDCEQPLEAALDALAARTEGIARAGQIPVSLGGEHSLTWGAAMGVSRALGRRIGIVQIDAHADLRRAYQGFRHSHASVMQLLVEEEGMALAQYGVRALCTQEAELRDRLGVTFTDAEDLVTGGSMEVTLPDDFPEDIYITFDVDGLDAPLMPATGTPVPGGLGYYQSLALVRSALRGRRCVGIDVVELAPIAGADVWDFTAAQLTYALIGIAQGG
ncbi:N(1)-aminopropylagmatine ureohydrolase [Roseibaca ekhonensis]|uniref:N(1)-aminopropylagmatine ureohydrolase n=1 Tax=Roseinatronobacter ekhonensis TaxID=254356 RepID=A0A3B0MAB8_9RHOB|nr:agmatinase family protein [Roseibaca ekhonensis]SUZ32875.1 N(1)-aminopropylagmatine ureohydrolase [Roseibaca ekhonensis]